MEANYGILNNIIQERRKQIEKWGDVYHSPIEYIALLAEELGEASRHAHELHWNGKFYDVDADEKMDLFRAELIQVAALAYAAIESTRKDFQHPATPRPEK